MQKPLLILVSIIAVVGIVVFFKPTRAPSNTPSNSPFERGRGPEATTPSTTDQPIDTTSPSDAIDVPANSIDALVDAVTSSGPPSQFMIEGVPYIHETPDGTWTGPWKNACEEASIAMVEFFYNGQSSVGKEEAKQRMMEFFDIEDVLWGQNANSDAAQTAQLINGYTSFTATVVENPTMDAIKQELLAGRPVISLHNGFELDNRNIPFLATGSGYHMMVMIGYNDVLDVFIVHDDGDEPTGKEHRYRYDLFMNSLHDYNAANKKTDDPARVLFTAPK